MRAFTLPEKAAKIDFSRARPQSVGSPHMIPYHMIPHSELWPSDALAALSFHGTYPTGPEPHR
jgi:hypothetical protein